MIGLGSDNNYYFLNTWPFQPPSSPCHRPMSQNKSNLYKVAGNRRIRLLLVTEKVYFLSYWDLKSLKLRLTSFMKTVTSLVSWASVSSQIVFFLLSKTETWLWICAHLNLTPNFDPIWRVEHDPQLGGKPAAPRILLHHYTSHKYGLKRKSREKEK